MEPDGEACDRCGQPARCYEIGVDDAHAYCGQVCQTAVRGQVRKTPQDCEKKLRRFRPIRALGAGKSGTVFAFVSNNGDEGALKVLRRVAEREILSHSQVTGLPGFLRLLDYWICDRLPSAMVARVSNTADDETREWFTGECRYSACYLGYTFMATERAIGTANELLASGILSREEAWQFWFEVVYAYNNAFVRLGFSHGDVHGDNILYVASGPRLYTLRDGSSVQCTSGVRPLWADFAEAGFGYKYPYRSDFVGLCQQMSYWDQLPADEVEMMAVAHLNAQTYDAWLLELADRFRWSV